MPKVKLLVAGSILGQFKSFFEEILKYNKKCGPFECLLCTGDFFGPNEKDWQQILCGIIEVPITTYILGPSSLEYKGYFKEPGELAPNVHYLGKSGILKLTSGLQIAYLSGIHGDGDKSVYFDEREVEDFISSLQEERKIDILLTSQWPKGITKHDALRIAKETAKNSSPLVSKLALAVKPRYHFSTCSGYFFVPTPYRNQPWPNESYSPVTRFYSLSHFGDVKKYVYAFNLTPVSRPDPEAPAYEPRDVTDCPLSATSFKIEPELTYIKHSYIDCAKRQLYSTPEIEKSAKKLKDDCWFCLSECVNQHLLISVGDHESEPGLESPRLETGEPPEISYVLPEISFVHPDISVSHPQITGVYPSTSELVDSGESFICPIPSNTEDANMDTSELEISSSGNTRMHTQRDNPVTGRSNYLQRMRALRIRRQKRSLQIQEDIKNHLFDIKTNITMINETMLKLLSNSEQQLQTLTRHLRNQNAIVSLLVSNNRHDDLSLD